MDRFVAEENVKRFKKLLAACADDQQRATLSELLAAEEAKLRDLERPRG